MCPTLRGRTLKVSMALAMLGLLIFLSASITVPSVRWRCGVAGSGAHGAPRRSSRTESRFGIHGQRLLEALERAGGLVEAEPDHAVAAQRAESARGCA